MSQNSSLQELDHASKQVAKCTGWKTPLEEHHWCIASKVCDGYEKSSPRKEAHAAPLEKEEDIMALEMEEQALRGQQNEERLCARIAEKRWVIEDLQRSKVQHENPGARSFTTRDLPKLEPKRLWMSF